MAPLERELLKLVLKRVFFPERRRVTMPKSNRSKRFVLEKKVLERWGFEGIGNL